MARFTSTDYKARLHVSNSNSKLGFESICYVAGVEETYKTGERITEIVGTCRRVDCSQCSKGCYALNSFRRYPAVTVNDIENTLHLRADLKKHFKAIDDYIREHKTPILRYTDRGEIESTKQLFEVVKLALNNPSTTIYLYTKNYTALKKVLEAVELPDNMRILVSIWGSTGVTEWEFFRHYKGVNAFVVNNPNYTGVNCPAYKLVNGKAVRTGKTCKDCKLCFTGNNRVINCVEH